MMLGHGLLECDGNGTMMRRPVLPLPQRADLRRTAKAGFKRLYRLDFKAGTQGNAGSARGMAVQPSVQVVQGQHLFPAETCLAARAAVDQRGACVQGEARRQRGVCW